MPTSSFDMEDLDNGKAIARDKHQMACQKTVREMSLSQQNNVDYKNYFMDENQVNWLSDFF